MFAVIGPGGMLGRAWVRHLETTGAAHQSLARADLDLARPDSADAVDWSKYDTVINCAAWTDVDGAETAEAAATIVNGESVARIAKGCAKSGVPLVHYSTDYVFSGNASSPYPVDAPLQPINAYGRSKAVGEEAIRAAGGPSLIVRTSWVYAAWGKNFVRTIAKLCQERDELAVVDDQRGRPTSATHLAATSAELLAAGATGTFHVTDGGICTWFDLATAVAATLNPKCRVEPCGSDKYPRPAPRPAYSVLELRATEALVGPMPRWQQQVAAVLAEIADEAPA